MTCLPEEYLHPEKSHTMKHSSLGVTHSGSFKSKPAIKQIPCYSKYLKGDTYAIPHQDSSTYAQQFIMKFNLVKTHT
jgi:hypothetical protein